MTFIVGQRWTTAKHGHKKQYYVANVSRINCYPIVTVASCIWESNHPGLATRIVGIDSFGTN